MPMLVRTRRFHDRPIFPPFTKVRDTLAEIFVLISIFVISYLIRRIGLNFGDPLIIHTDEPNILIPVYNMTVNQTFNPDNFIRPDQILYMLNFIYLNIVSLVKTGQVLSVTFPTDPFFYYYSARVLIAVFGSLIPIVAYQIGKACSIKYAIPAALLFMFFPAYVNHSHYVTPDVPITLFTLIIILFSIRYIRSKKVEFLYLAAIFVAINTAEKYPGVIAFGVLLFAIIWVNATRYKNEPLRLIKNTLMDGVRCFFLFALALFVLAPNLFIHYQKAITQITIEARDTHPGADGLGWLGNMNFYLHDFLSYANILIVLLAIVGVIGIVKTRKYELLVLFYGFLYCIILSKLALHWGRWGLPMYTMPLLLAAFGIGYLWQVQNWKRILRPLLALAVCLSTAWSLLFAFSISINLTYQDTRVAAFNYCKEAGITEENTIYEGYTPFLPGKFKTLDVGELKSTTKYVILSSNMYHRFYLEPTRYPDQIAKYDSIKNKSSLLKFFYPTSLLSTNRFKLWLDNITYYLKQKSDDSLPDRYTGPTILIYQVTE